MSNCSNLVISFLQKIDLILQHRDPTYDLKSDRILNVYSYVKEYSKTNPDEATRVVIELNKNFKYYTNKYSEAHPERIQDLLNGMKKVLGITE